MIGRGTHGGYDPSWRHTGQQQVGRYLADDIANCENGRAGYKLVAVHLQVLLHATQKGIVDVAKVDVLEEVSDLSDAMLVSMLVLLGSHEEIRRAPRQM